MRSFSTRLMVLVCATALGCTDKDPADDGDDSVGDTGDGDEDTTGDTGETGDTGNTSETADTDSTETGVDECDPWQLICDQTGGMQAAMDCGIVTDSDGVAAWQTAQQCALDAIAQTSAFKVMGQFTGDDSLISNAYGAVEGVVYAPVWLYHDTFGPPAEIRNCTTLVAEPNCTVAVGNLCLSCVEPGEPTPLCE